MGNKLSNHEYVDNRSAVLDEQSGQIVLANLLLMEKHVSAINKPGSRTLLAYQNNFMNAVGKNGLGLLAGNNKTYIVVVDEAAVCDQEAFGRRKVDTLYKGNEVRIDSNEGGTTPSKVTWVKIYYLDDKGEMKSGWVSKASLKEGSGQIVSLTQMQQVERTDAQGKAVEAWRFNSSRDILTWSTTTYIPTYTAYRSIEQKDVDAINTCLTKYDITGDQIPHFIAQCSHECGCGASGIEKYDGSDPATYFRDRDIWRENFDAADLAATAHIWNNKTAIEQYALANNLNAKYKGYGAKYRGAGALQMTHYCEYKPYSDYIGDSTILTAGAGRVAEAYFWDSAGWLWKEYYKMLEKFANGAIPSINDITLKINGGYNGLAERDNFYKCCKKIF